MTPLRSDVTRVRKFHHKCSKVGTWKASFLSRDITKQPTMRRHCYVATHCRSINGTLPHRGH